MRNALKHSKKSQRGSSNVGSYNRPRNIFRDGENIPLHPALYGETPAVLEPDSPLKLSLQNDPARLDWISDGQSRDQTRRIVEYMRELLRQEPASLHKHKLGRNARGRAGFRHWVDRLSERELCEELRRRSDPLWLGDHRYGRHDDYQLNWQPKANGRQTHGGGQQSPWQRYNIDRGRPSGHRNANVNLRGPRNIPLLPPLENAIYLSGGTCEVPCGRGGPLRRVHGSPITTEHVPNLRSGRHKSHRGKSQQGPYGRHIVEHMPRTHPGFFTDFDPLDDDDRPFLIPRYPFGREDYDEDDEDDTMSQYTTLSYVRSRSPNIVNATLPPRHNGRHEPDTDDEDDNDDDEVRERFGFMGRRRSPYGMGREGGRFGTRRRGYEDEDLFRDDEDGHF